MEDDVVKVILCEDVINLGEMGQTVKVKDGYARNFLIPRRLAVQADSASAKEIEHQMRIIRRREAKRREELKGVAQQLAKVSLEFKMRAGSGDKLYGSVTTTHIAQKLKEQGFTVDRRNIKLAEPIKTVGVHTVSLKLGSGVEADVAVSVEKDQSEDEAAAAIAAELKAAEEEEAASAAREAEEAGAEAEAESEAGTESAESE